MKWLEDYIKKLDNKLDIIKLGSTLKTLEQIDKVIFYHNNHSDQLEEAIIIDIFGLLQSLFVGVDALYVLTLTLTKNKAYININQNKTLNHLKHIRNDIVGHPISRKYGDSGIGYSIIKTDSLNYDSFDYTTYLKTNGEISKTETSVDLSDMKEQYLKEKNIITERLKAYVILDKKSIDFSDLIYSLLHDFNIDNLYKIKNKFINNFGNIETHRFIWRIDLIEYLLNYKTADKEIEELINYLKNIQAVKLLEINYSMLEVKKSLPKIKNPYIIKKTFEYLNENTKYADYIRNLHDANNPYFKSDLNYLLKNVDNKHFIKLLELINNADNPFLIYLIGSVLKKYQIR